MSNSEVYSKEVIDQLKDSCEKIKEIFNTVHTQKAKQEEFIKKISNFDNDFSSMLSDMGANLKKFNAIIENVNKNIKKAEEDYNKKIKEEENRKENENKNKKIEELKNETKYLQEYYKLMEEHNKISLVIEEQKIKKKIATKDLEKKYGINIIQKKKPSSKPTKNVDTEEHIRRRSTHSAHPLAAALKAKFKGARGED
tara:strand:+ start:1475 stop:2068 length:594 start_codon:yes stop_codon:yes gene_type:complete